MFGAAPVLVPGVSFDPIFDSFLRYQGGPPTIPGEAGGVSESGIKRGGGFRKLNPEPCAISGRSTRMSAERQHLARFNL
jgi:hypothetical protein